jgi:[acyl-carrier-protein] S-malonyltransferase
MLDPFRDAPRFSEYYDLVCNLLHEDPMDAARRNPGCLNRNAISSLLTVLASVLALEEWRRAAPSLQPIAVGGYSVGQWTALHAAGALSVKDLLTVVCKRAGFMDGCIGNTESSGMLAVIGLPAASVLSVCDEAAGAGMLLQITNDNAPGQFTLGGTEGSLRFAEERLQALKPKRLQRVPTAGAWHSKLLEGAVPLFEQFLRGLVMSSVEVPVVDNTTGDWLPQTDGALRTALSRHIASPVLWRQCVQKLAAFGAREFIEVGYGDILTKYGFFIDRSLRHTASAPGRRAVS